VFDLGVPQELFSVSQRGEYPLGQMILGPSGDEFLFLKPVRSDDFTPTRINVVTNWSRELLRLAPTR
jgi:hypothetical protein